VNRELNKRAIQPFRFYTRQNLMVATGKKAKDARTFLHILKEVPGSVVYYHTHHFLQQHQHLSPEPPNDFAYWIREVLGEEELGEKVAAIDILDCNNIREFRERIIHVLEEYIACHQDELRKAPYGQEFSFIRAITFIVPTQYIAHTLEEFSEYLKRVSIHSLYYHIFEARLRLAKGENDFSYWLRTSLGEQKLAQELASLDPYTHTMESLRTRIYEILKKVG